MDKKAQAQIITVVLIILLVLAAIVIVWQVIRSTVTESAEEVAGGTECITMALDLVEPVSDTDTTITVKRGVGAATLDKIRVIIDGTTETLTGPGGDADASTLDELESLIITLENAITTPEVGDKVEIAGLLENGKLCDVADYTDIVA